MYYALETEGALELSGTDAERLVACPLGIQIQQLHRRLAGSLDVGALNLGAPVKVAYLAVEYQAHKPQVERAALIVFFLVLVLVCGLILHHAIAAQPDVSDPLGNLNSSRLFRRAPLSTLLSMDCQTADDKDGG